MSPTQMFSITLAPRCNRKICWDGPWGQLAERGCEGRAVVLVGSEEPGLQEMRKPWEPRPGQLASSCSRWLPPGLVSSLDLETDSFSRNEKGDWPSDDLSLPSPKVWEYVTCQFRAATKYLLCRLRKCQVDQLEKCQREAEGPGEVCTGPHGTRGGVSLDSCTNYTQCITLQG